MSDLTITWRKCPECGCLSYLHGPHVVSREYTVVYGDMTFLNAKCPKCSDEEIVSTGVIVKKEKLRNVLEENSSKCLDNKEEREKLFEEIWEGLFNKAGRNS